ncbi:GTP pyrophosphokinase family protein [Salicibibacter halophilus]|uniref:GTP diphosphokinase n=1 Tax=Salicibibacter halophilus TaxID=2502791 RepID=A0A514LGA0_9BACI|nr:GTP pyrophosphokinase family protein [Salicibibacter halophilus]QDI90876.1 GTP pyrophosphokinase family protein [Salicibibacter halophilus]
MNGWAIFLSPYHQAVEELKVKFKSLRDQYQRSSKHTPIEFVTGRVKPMTSIQEKAKRKSISLEHLHTEMQDIAGLRIVCQFVTDIDTVVDMLQSRNDITVISERDYIKEEKSSGYRSYHMVIDYPVHTIEGTKHVLAEIQIRTMAMNFWATIEHSLNYKYSGEIPEHVKRRLVRAAEAAYNLDEEMSKIQDEVREAQSIITKRREENRGYR